MIAKLGGFLGRKSDGEPGTETLWRGLLRLDGMTEGWRVQEEQGLSIQKIDQAVTDAKTAPMGPFFLGDLLGLDTVLHVAEHLQKSYGERFYVSPEMKELVGAGNFGQKTGKGFYEHGS